MGMRTGRPVAKVELSAQVAGILEGYAQRRKTAQGLALRARIVLGCAAGLSNKAVAAGERVTAQTVGKWRQRFIERGVDGLLDAPRPGVPRKIDDVKVQSVLVETLESQPSGATHLSTRSMARHSGLSISSIGRIWLAFGLQPHRMETFKLSGDPLFVAKGPRHRRALPQPARPRPGFVRR
jgi:transposase